MSRPSVSIGVTTFNAPQRLQAVLRAIDYFGRPQVPIRVFEDPWNKALKPWYAEVVGEFGFPYDSVPPSHRVAKNAVGWSCMQGVIEYAVEQSPEDWFLYYPDDILPTPGAIQNCLDWIERLDPTPVGAFEMPHWNVDDLPSGIRPWDSKPSSFQYAKDAMWQEPFDWLKKVPRNTHWDGPFNKPYPYVNLNGAGFALRRSIWEKVGGFAQETWCLDEDIGAKIWLRTEQMVVTVPGPPFVHYMGAAMQHPEHAYHSIEAWKRAGWPDKDVVHRMTRDVIADRCGGFRYDDDPFDLLDNVLPQGDYSKRDTRGMGLRTRETIASGERT